MWSGLDIIELSTNGKLEGKAKSMWWSRLEVDWGIRIVKSITVEALFKYVWAPPKKKKKPINATN